MNLAGDEKREELEICLIHNADKSIIIACIEETKLGKLSNIETIYQ